VGTVDRLSAKQAERKNLAERRFSSLGKIERCAKEQDKTGARAQAVDTSRKEWYIKANLALFLAHIYC
jgi:hypothetical protein